MNFIRTGLFALSSFLMLNSAVFANPFETLVMPGDLIQGHKKLESDCKNCHVVFKKGGQNKLCLDCHKVIKKDVRRRRGYHGRNKSVTRAQCKSCHTDHKGRRVDIIKLDKETFNHDLTDFKLRGQHKVIECTECHKKNKKYRKAKSQCRSCHSKESPHKKAKAKKGLFKKCQSCHRPSGWNKIYFNHNKKTKYKLTGRHKEALCQSCHLNQRYTKTPKKCISCHKADDIHDGDNGEKCKKCHSTKKWGQISFNHNRHTNFKLRYKHKKTSCRSCHKKSPNPKKKIKKKKKARSCYSCHSYDDRHNGVFGKKCKSCHVDKAWDISKFNHNKDTKFKKTGRHKKLKCESCHKSYKKKLKTTCVSCHEDDDVHKGDLGRKCNSCHITSNWKQRVKFEHDLTHFPLMGMHSAVSCEECHSSGYRKLDKSCDTCHKTDDIHKGKLGKNCHRCHTPNDWAVWFFKHNKQSKFKITGKHKGVHCHSCHNQKINKIHRRPRDCQSCHSHHDPHNGQFGSRCNDCHNTKDFSKIKMR